MACKNWLYDDVEKAKRFNSFFSSVFTHVNGIIPFVISKAKPNSFTDIDFTYDDVFNELGGKRNSRTSFQHELSDE